MRALFQTLRSRRALSRGRAAPWGLAAPGRGATAAAPAAAGQQQQAGSSGSTSSRPSLREYLIYRWDADKFQSYSVDVDSCGPMLLDVLLKVRDEQDPSLAVKFGCRRGRCGACASVVNGASLLPCITPVNKAVTGVSTVKGLLPPLLPVAAKDCW